MWCQELIKYFHDKGANIFHKDKRRISPIHYAASKGNIFALDFMYNVVKDDEQKLKDLLDMQTKGGETALTRAAKFNQVMAIQRLLEYGADEAIVNG